MKDFTEAAKNEATVRLADGNTVRIHFNPSGTEGWLEDVIIAYEEDDTILSWDVDGKAHAVGVPDIVEDELTYDPKRRRTHET